MLETIARRLVGDFIALIRRTGVDILFPVFPYRIAMHAAFEPMSVYAGLRLCPRSFGEYGEKVRDLPVMHIVCFIVSQDCHATIGWTMNYVKSVTTARVSSRHGDGSTIVEYVVRSPTDLLSLDSHLV